MPRFCNFQPIDTANENVVDEFQKFERKIKFEIINIKEITRNLFMSKAFNC